mmetsp:Transcript_23080/g.68681  ORF Transcript_23080/g.68681 Transcript_23080/m.68681 type:complete len:597 (+) Transcript_23080:79-1869(+)
MALSPQSPVSPMSLGGGGTPTSRRPPPIVTASSPKGASTPKSAAALVLQGTPRSQAPILVDWGKLMCFNVEEFPEMDPTAEVASPRSVEACESEGVRPQDLTYVPYAAFAALGASPEVCRLRHDFFEARRQDVLMLVRTARQRIIQNWPGRNTLTMGNPAEAYPHLFVFFKEEGQKITPNNPDCAKDWKMSPRTEDFKPISSFKSGGSDAGFGAVSMSATEALNAFGGESFGESHYLGTTLEPGDDEYLGATLGAVGEDQYLSTPLGAGTGVLGGSPMGSPMGAGAGAAMSAMGSPNGASQGLRASSLGASWRSQRAEAELPDLFQTLRESPGAGMVEEDMARRAENNYIALRQDAKKAMGLAHKDQTRLTSTRCSGLASSFKRLVHEQKVNNRYREIRQFMSPAAGKAGNTGGLTRSKEHLYMMAMKEEGRRQEYTHSRAHRDMALQRKQMEKAYQDRIKFAQVNVEDRLRWRHNYSTVEGDNEEHKENILENARRRQAQITAIANRAAADNSTKTELHNLRSTARLLSEMQLVRKDTYQDWKIRDTKRTLAIQRMQKSHRTGSLPNLKARPRDDGLALLSSLLSHDDSQEDPSS